MNEDRLKVSIELEHSILTQKKSTPKRIYLLLHGYLLDAKYILETLLETLPEDSLIIAPNGPFLVPVKKKEVYKSKYAWYFFDPRVNNFYVDFEPAAVYLKKILENYNTEKLPVTVIGYSQGGYLAPKLANLVPEVDTIIGLACAFRSKRFEYMPSVVYHQINSASDLIVDLEGAKEEFLKLTKSGNTGQFLELKGSGHRIDNNYLEKLKELLP